MDNSLEHIYKNMKIRDLLVLLNTYFENKLYNIGYAVGKYFIPYFPNDIELVDMTAKCALYAQKYYESYIVYSDTLNNLRTLDENESYRLKYNQSLSAIKILDLYTEYIPHIVQNIVNKTKKRCPLITFSITTCKRYDLFEKTMNSFLNCCIDLDLIDEWILVDDNSSEEDRKLMKEKYPFFKFIFKDISDKGHPRSMNIIKNIVKSPYLFHIEDDWKFFERKTYILDCLSVLNSSTQIGQCLVNKNYTELCTEHDVKGGILCTTKTGIRYYIHEFCPTEELKNEFVRKYGNCRSSNYWAHFSFRPSLFKTSIFKDIGDFNENIEHFEREYSYRYINKNYISAFLESIYCTHIGRLTTEINDDKKINAYSLNNEIQFVNKQNTFIHQEIINQEFNNKGFNNKGFIDKTVDIQVINLEERTDRWDNFIKYKEQYPKLNFIKFNAINGKKIKPTIQLQQIFDGNDYNMRSGMVGCALSHLKLYIDFYNSNQQYLIVLEDDVKLVPEFDDKLLYLIKILETRINNIDLIYLCHHVYPKYKTDDMFDLQKYPEISQWSKEKSLLMSMGGTGGLILSKNGVKKLLEFINKTGMTNGIDTVQQKSADILNIYYCNPQICHAECFISGVSETEFDSDIQFDYTSLSIDVNKRLLLDIEFYNETKQTTKEIKTFHELIETIIYKKYDTDVIYFVSTPFVINNIKSLIDFPYYTLNDYVLFIVTKPNDNKRYFDRLKKNNKYNINDVFV